MISVSCGFVVGLEVKIEISAWKRKRNLEWRGTFCIGAILGAGSWDGTRPCRGASDAGPSMVFKCLV